MSEQPGAGQGKKEELESLNADDLDVQELDEALLEEAAGGEFSQNEVPDCAAFSCSNYFC